MLAFPIAGTSASAPWFVGVAGGASSLRPDTTNSPFEIDSNLSFGAGAFVGYDFSTRISFEAGYNYLGAATLSGQTGKNDIEYSALSAGALIYVLGDELDIAERNGFAGYLRLGLNSISNSASIPLEQEDNFGIWAGVGFELPVSQNLSLRGEVASFDGDAQTARLALLYRLRSDGQTEPGIRLTVIDSAPAQQQIESAQQEPTLAESPADPTPASSVEQPARETVQTSPDITENLCVAPINNEPIDAQGCGLFSGLLEGVDFASGTANLTVEGSRILDQLSDDLLRYESIVIEIQAHTEAFGSEQRANQIAKQRTITIARHLIDRGVPVSRLKARSFGHSRPLAADDTVVGRQQNNRVELRVLP